MPRRPTPTRANKNQFGKNSLVLFWLAVPVMIVLGASVGYVVSETWMSNDHQAGAVSGPDAHSGHEGHGAMETEPPVEGDPGEHAGHEGHGAMETEPPVEGDAGEHAGHEGHEGDDSAVNDGATSATEPATDSTSTHSGHTATDTVERPRTAVLTTFGAINVAILLAAALLRRNNRRPRPVHRAATRTVSPQRTEPR